MRTRRVLGPLWVSLMIMAVPAAAQTPNSATPAAESICDPLANATPGLQGLCVAMCEAQACVATLEEEVQADGTVQTAVKFSPSCNPSTPQILENYNKIKDRDPTDDDPEMPCLQVACPCWAADDIGEVADQFDTCVGGAEWAMLYGSDTKGGTEFSYTGEDAVAGFACSSLQQAPVTSKSKAPISKAGYTTCRKSVIRECRARGLDTSWVPPNE